MITVLKVAAFLRRHHAPCRTWPKKNLVSWLLWLWELDAVACVTDKGRLTGVGIARPVRSIVEGRDHYAVANGGTILWVDLAAARNPRVIALLLKQARERWGERLYVAFHRRKWARDTVLPWAAFMNRFNEKGA